MLYQILTMINLMGCIYALYRVWIFINNYETPERFHTYLLLNFMGMVALMLSQLYLLVSHNNNEWELKIGSIFWWCNKLFLINALKFSSLPKMKRKLKPFKKIYS